MEKKDKKQTFWTLLSGVLSTEKVRDTLIDLILKLLKSQALGGFRGYLLRKLVKEFSEEVLKIASDVIDYVDISTKVDSTVNNEDRNEATDLLNDIMR